MNHIINRILSPLSQDSTKEQLLEYFLDNIDNFFAMRKLRMHFLDESKNYGDTAAKYTVVSTDTMSCTMNEYKQNGAKIYDYVHGIDDTCAFRFYADDGISYTASYSADRRLVRLRYDNESLGEVKTYMIEQTNFWTKVSPA